MGVSSDMDKNTLSLGCVTIFLISTAAVVIVGIFITIAAVGNEVIEQQEQTRRQLPPPSQQQQQQQQPVYQQTFNQNDQYPSYPVRISNFKSVNSNSNDGKETNSNNNNNDPKHSFATSRGVLKKLKNGQWRLYLGDKLASDDIFEVKPPQRQRQRPAQKYRLSTIRRVLIDPKQQRRKVATIQPPSFAKVGNVGNNNDYYYDDGEDDGQDGLYEDEIELAKATRRRRIQKTTPTTNLSKQQQQQFNNNNNKRRIIKYPQGVAAE